MGTVWVVFVVDRLPKWHSWGVPGRTGKRAKKEIDDGKDDGDAGGGGADGGALSGSGPSPRPQDTQDGPHEGGSRAADRTQGDRVVLGFQRRRRPVRERSYLLHLRAPRR